jgi:hypothetical protein
MNRVILYGYPQTFEHRMDLELVVYTILTPDSATMLTAGAYIPMKQVAQEHTVTDAVDLVELHRVVWMNRHKMPTANPTS